jgi:hypothetical protein
VVVVVVHVKKRSCQANKQIQNHRNVATQTRIHQQESHQNKGCGLAIYIKKYLKAKNYGNSNISPCKNIPNLLKNALGKETKILEDITTL